MSGWTPRRGQSPRGQPSQGTPRDGPLHREPRSGVSSNLNNNAWQQQPRQEPSPQRQRPRQEQQPPSPPRQQPQARPVGGQSHEAPAGYTPRGAQGERGWTPRNGRSTPRSASESRLRRSPPEFTPTGYTGNAIAPHTRPKREVTGKVTGNPADHRPLSSPLSRGGRTVAPFARKMAVEGKVSESRDPVHRPQAIALLHARGAGAPSGELNTRAYAAYVRDGLSGDASSRSGGLANASAIGRGMVTPRHRTS